MSIWLLFISAFGAATLLPLQSEAVLFGLLVQNQYAVSLLIIVASIGNILGSCVNWYLGCKLEHYKHKKYFPISVEQIQKAQKIYKKYGFWSLLLSWVPIIGDPITLIAGLLRENFVRFLLLVSIAKVARYLFIYAVFVGLWA